MKLLSIIIPVYNNKNVYKALESIIKLDEVEIIVVDGKSNAETLEAINKYKDKIDIFISENDNGLYDAMNKGIKRASGKWIITLAADDKLLCNPTDIINKYEGTNSDLLCGSLVAKDFENRYFIMSPDTDINKLQLECTLCHPGTFFRKSVYEEVGLYNQNYKCAADHDMFLRIAKQGLKIQIIPEIITYFSYGGTSTINPFRAFKEDIKISDAYGVLKLKSRGNLIKRIIKYYGAQVKDKFHLSHKTNFMDQKQLDLYLKNHPEVLLGNFK